MRQPSSVEIVQLRYTTEKYSFVLDLPCMCTEHSSDWGMIFTKGSHHITGERSSISMRMLPHLM